jgi:TPR repeat protein
MIREVAERSGMAVAQFNMGSLYENGCGVPKNLAMAAPWYSKAAAQGLGAAQHALGLCFELGKGVDINTAGRCTFNPAASPDQSAW